MLLPLGNPVATRQVTQDPAPILVAPLDMLPAQISKYGAITPTHSNSAERHFGARSGFDPVGGCYAVDAAVEGDDVGYSGGLG